MTISDAGLGRVVAGVVMAALLGLSLLGCTEEGPSAAAGNEQLTSCLDSVDASLAGSEDWSTDQQREFMSRPDVLQCFATEVGPGDTLDRAMQGAFGDSTFDDVLGVLEQYVRDSAGATGLAERAGTLAGALDPDDYEDWNSARVDSALAWAVLAKDGSPTGFADWLADHPDESADSRESAMTFVQHLDSQPQDSPGYRLYRRYLELRSAVHDARTATP